MPLYEYKCRLCDKTFEVLQRFSDAPLTSHEGCGGSVERLLSPPALQFKGTGWYVTDYARGSSNGSASRAQGENGSGKKKDESGKSASDTSKPAESKSAPKPA